MEKGADRVRMNIVTVGHVDHGKSTIIGRLLADSNSLSEGKLEQVKNYCEKNSKPFEYAFLIDALKDEQRQGITIDLARVFIKTKKRDYLILDAPGHIEFLKNMVTGASHAEAALLVIDAQEGVMENSRRHGYMLSMLGIKQVAVLVNKMDLVSFEKSVFEHIVDEYNDFLSNIHIIPACFVPVSGMTGDNIAKQNNNMPWYQGVTVLEVLDTFEKGKALIDKPLRMPVQDVYKFTNFGDHRRIVVGTIETGSLKLGDEIVFYPSGKKSRIATLECFNRPSPQTIDAGYAAGFTLTEQIYLRRGEFASKSGEKRPKVTSRLRVSLFWLGKHPMVKDKDYILKLGTAKVQARIEEIFRIVDASSLKSADSKERKERIERHDVAECILKLSRAVAFDLVEDIASTGRFVIVDDFEICGGGIILEDLQDRQTWVRDKLFLRDYKWEKSMISQERRTEKYHQKPTLILITGERDSGKKPFAKKLEARLFEDGKLVYFLGIGNILYGVDSDIKGQSDSRQEHIRRLAEVAHILLDAGVILIVTAIKLTQDDLDLIGTIINPDRIVVIWTGEGVTTDITYDIKIGEGTDINHLIETVRAEIQEKDISFKSY
jgi:bifunctional enzyme CysN/CysC